MYLLEGTRDSLAILLCFLGISTNCIRTEDQQIDIYQWTSNGRIPLPSDYSTVNSEAPTHFIVHGWPETSFSAPYEVIAQNYYIMDPTSNILLVDYGKMAAQSYLKAWKIVDNSGTLMGEKIIDMLQHGVLQLKKIQIFCHSLGTHVSGKAARVVKAEIGDTVARISATDPAGPLFRFPTAIPHFSESLTKEDTDFLDITHASATMGTIKSFGTVDTYVGILGVHQPACHFPPLNGDFVDELLFCDHRMARTYFTESILSCGFKQTNGTTIVYGQHTPLNSHGIYSMMVNADSPYAQSPNTYPECYTQ